LISRNNSRSLFKFRKFDKKSKAILLNKELWFPEPKTLNDPFDCQVEHERMLESFLEKNNLTNRNKIKDEINRKLNTIGVCSFSRARKNQLMWSHYADEHKGFCIGFREDLFYPHPQLLNPIDVKYQGEHPFHSKSFPHHKYNGNHLDDIVAFFIKEAIGTKYTYWKYERERRIVRDKSGAHKFEAKQVVSVAFGLKMETEHKDVLIKLMQNPEWHHVKFYQAKKSPKKFALEFSPIALEKYNLANSTDAKYRADG
jgi:hypothetical protein